MGTPVSAEELTARLEALLGRWNEIVEERAAEIAAPRIAAAQRQAVQAKEDARQATLYAAERVEDLRGEVDRQIAAHERASKRDCLRFEELLGTIYLYVDWFSVTRQLTSAEKELFGDAVDAFSARLNKDSSETGALVPRWWRDGSQDAQGAS